MAFDEETLATRAREHIAEGDEGMVGYSIPRLTALIPEALNRLAIKVAASDDREELQKTITSSAGLTLAAGVATITDGTILKNSIPFGGTVVVTASSVSTIAKPLPNYAALFTTQTVQPDLFHYALRGNEIHFKDKSTGNPDVISGSSVSVSVTASYVPTISEVPTRFQSTLVEILAKLGREQLKQTPAALPPASDPPAPAGKGE